VKEGPGSKALAVWLDRHGPLVLAVEFAVMFVSGTLAMVTEHRAGPRRGAVKRSDPGTS
jgi:hypothetical protein